MRTDFHAKGQTLIEALVTIVFISISVIALIRFQNYLAYDNSLSQQKAEATILATRQIEILREFQVLNNVAGYTSYQSIVTSTSTSSGVNTTYTINSTITTNTNPDYKIANVTVTWTDRTNQSRSVQLVTDIAGIDPSNSAAVI